MVRLTKYALSLAVLATATLVISGCSGAGETSDDTTSSEVLPGGKLTSAIHLGFPPLEYTDLSTDEIVGFDVDMLDAIAEVLGVEVVLETMEWQQMMPSLETGRVDVIMSGTYDTEERQERFDWIDYLRDGGQMFTTAAHADEFTEIGDFCGETIGSVRGEKIADELVAWSQANCPADQQFDIVLGQGAPDLFTYLAQDRVVGAATPAATLAFQMAESPGAFVTVDEQLSPNYFGIAILKSEPALRDAIWDALQQLRDDGTYDALLEKHGLADSKLTDFTLNLEKP